MRDVIWGITVTDGENTYAFCVVADSVLDAIEAGSETAEALDICYADGITADRLGSMEDIAALAEYRKEVWDVQCERMGIERLKLI